MSHLHAEMGFRFLALIVRGVRHGFGARCLMSFFQSEQCLRGAYESKGMVLRERAGPQVVSTWSMENRKDKSVYDSLSADVLDRYSPAHLTQEGDQAPQSAGRNLLCIFLNSAPAR